METRHKVMITMVGLILLVFLLYYTTEIFSKTTGYTVGEDERIVLAQCLSGKGIILYSSRFCSDCFNQKEIFGPGIKFINYVDCDNYPENCSSIDMDKIPGWEINGTVNYGFLGIKELKILSGC